jgi:hypothetical protein
VNPIRDILDLTFVATWKRSPMWYRLFLIVGAVTALPLVVLIFVYTDDPKSSWIASWAFGGLIAIGVVGACRAIYVYHIRKEASPMRQLLDRWRDAGK